MMTLMSGVFDFFKHDDQGASTATTTTASDQTTTTPTSYNGIGAPPSGNSYNGIGTPPSGSAYSGIGAPPAPVQSAPIDTQAINPPPTQSQTPPAQMNQTPATSTQNPTTLPNPNLQTQTTENNTTPTTSTNPATQDQKQTQNGNQLASNIDNDKRTQLDMMTHLTQRSNRVFLAANQKAKELKNKFVDSEHLLFGLTTDSEIYKILTNEKIPVQNITDELGKVFKTENNVEAPIFSPRVKRILDRALVSARKLGYEFISPEHLLFAVLDEGEGAGAVILNKLGFKKEVLQKKVLGDTKNALSQSAGDPTKTQKSALASFTIDLTEKAAKGLLDPVVERSDVIERAIHILSRRSKNNPALIGEAGVGKTAIVEGLAQKIVKKEVPEALLSKKVLQFDLMSIVAGASHRGEFEERMKNLIQEIQASNGQIILFIDEMHNLVGAGNSGEGSLDVANFIKPALARGEMQMIGATTITEYNRYITKDPALERRFQPVIVPEPTVEAAIKMLKATRDKYEAFHRVSIPDAAIEAAANLSKRYVGGRFLPDKAVDLIDEAAAAVRLPLISLPEEIKSLEERIAQRSQEIDEAKKSGNRVRVSILEPKLQDLKDELKIKQDDFTKRKSQSTSAVTEEVIKQVIARWTGIPVTKITSSETGRLTNLESIMHTRLIGQRGAVTSVSQAVRRGRAGLKSAKRPIGSFIFLGPTGVGKTELAKTLAEVLFGQEDLLIRFDMTEYMEKHEVAKLLGAPPGYVGYEEGGKLTEAVKRKPYSVVLFDEVEKAHPDIFNILLQILDDGRLTDNKGNTISFKDTVIICTSNIGTATIQQELLSAGKLEISEPTVISSFAFSPRGRQIMTIMNKVFVKDAEKSPWNSQMMVDYFAGQSLDKPLAKEGQPAPTDPKYTSFPNATWDTHAMSSKGEEMISVGEMMYVRTATTNKTWTAKSLIEYFTDHTVINAMPDAPEDQLPTVKLKTHAFSPEGKEIVTLADKYWRRGDGATDWEVGNLADYFGTQTVVNAGESDKSKTNSPISTDQKAPENAQTTDKSATENSLAKKDAPNDGEKSATPAPSLPITYWDIHTFTPSGDEIIVVGEQIFKRTASASEWQVDKLTTYFGADFPLAKETAEKQKIEEEVAVSQYDRIKTKVMDELKKFFRPELINRFDEVIIFEPLYYQDMLKIAELQMKALKKLMEEQSLSLRWNPAALKFIVKEGFDPIFGARPLRRAIQRLVENPISSLIIDGTVKEGDSVVVDFDGQGLTFTVERVEMVPAEKLADEKPKKMFCNLCGSNFESIIVKNATPICAVCGSKDVQFMVGESPVAKDGAAEGSTEDKKSANGQTSSRKEGQVDQTTSPKPTNDSKDMSSQTSSNQNTPSNQSGVNTIQNQEKSNTVSNPNQTKSDTLSDFPLNLPPTPTPDQPTNTVSV